MKFAFFILASFLLLQNYHARHLHDTFVNRRFGRPSTQNVADVLQMVTLGEELQLPSLSQEKTTYGRVNNPPPPPPQGGSTRGQTTYARVNPKAPPSPSAAPSRGQTTFGAENATFTSQTTQTSPDTSDLDIHGMYGRVDPRTPPSPEANGSQGHDLYGRDNPSVSTPPKPADPIRPVLNEYALIDVQ